MSASSSMKTNSDDTTEMNPAIGRIPVRVPNHSPLPMRHVSMARQMGLGLFETPLDQARAIFEALDPAALAKR